VWACRDIDNDVKHDREIPMRLTFLRRRCSEHAPYIVRPLPRGPFALVNIQAKTAAEIISAPDASAD
jgi:hypothetical protein